MQHTIDTTHNSHIMIFGCEVKIDEKRTFKIKKLYSENAYTQFAKDALFVPWVFAVVMLLMTGVAFAVEYSVVYNAKVISVECVYKNTKQWCTYTVDREDVFEPFKISEMESTPKYNVGDNIPVELIGRFPAKYGTANDSGLAKPFAYITIGLFCVPGIIVLWIIALDMISIGIIKSIIYIVNHNIIENVKND